MPSPSERFPRGTDLPSQSPQFWVAQKDRYLRQLLIRDVEIATGRRLIVYFGNRFANAQIDHGDCAYMNELLSDIGKTEPTDLVVETNGGLTDAVEGLITLIQNRVDDLRVAVTNAAKSNGTVLALAARSIVMGAPSELGPIEPYVGGIPCSILTEPRIEKDNFVLHKSGHFALQQTKSLAKRLLMEGMFKGKAEADVDALVQKLASRDYYYSHGSVLDHREAEALGLAVTYLPPGDRQWEQLWLLHCMYEADCKKNGLLKVFEGRKLSTAVAVPPASPKP
ncbi:MAG TPA: hypothetical protein VGL35_03335 [Rhizomicrobium sp.]|jgi:hypothetical protein